MREVTLGIDIGGTNSTIGLVDNSGEMIYEANLSTRSINNVDEFFQLLKIELEKIPDESTILGVGVGAPSANHYTGRIEHAPNLYWGDNFAPK